MERSKSAGRNLAMEAVRVTEAAARASNEFMGRGDEKAADQGAVLAMSVALGGLAIDGTIRIGEAAGNGGSLLIVGDKTGTGEGPAVDVALMPIEGPT
ncbi:MAG TPA: fructose-bisphosphatase class II, partial [Rhodospirillales bacterium]|nr:fructose-bisphosphatase class II [Rhodospirillales bacterium]